MTRGMRRRPDQGAAPGREAQARAATGTWRGWTASGGVGTSVESARLAPGTPVESRVFPKIRSWWALGAPLELMSPLSVLRVLFLVGALSWSLCGVVWRPATLGDAALLVGAGAAMAATWAALLVVRSISATWCAATAALWVAECSALEWYGHGAGAAVGALALVLPGALFVALFLAPGVVLAYVLGGAAATGGVLAPALGAGRAAGVAAIATVAIGSVAGIVTLLNRSARQRETVDPDTGVPNGFGLADRLAPSLAAGNVVVVAALALEGIGEAREAMGYHVGTELLRRAVEDVGQVLPAGALVGRVDADEVVVVHAVGRHPDRPDHPDGPDLPEGEDLPDGPGTLGAGTPAPAGSEPDERSVREGRELAETLRKSIKGGRYLIDGVEVALRPHVGLAIAPWDGTAVPELVRRASLSARRAVADGALVATWDAGRGAMTPEDLALLSELTGAGSRGELWLAYQPQVDAGSGSIVAVEALIRWHHPRLGALGPGRFVPLAERTGLVDRLTEWVLAEALDAQVRWRRRGIDLGVSVNFSARTLARPDLPALVLGALAARRLEPACLTVEMTETAAANLARATEVLGPLRDAGVRVSIDDFGSGYTSLGALRTLPLDELKIDLQFVQRSATSAADDAIVRSVSQLAHRLGVVAVAEGVEEAATARRMADAGYDLLQGYHFSKPVPEAELLARHLAPTAPAGAPPP